MFSLQSVFLRKQKPCATLTFFLQTPRDALFLGYYITQLFPLLLSENKTENKALLSAGRGPVQEARPSEEALPAAGLTKGPECSVVWETFPTAAEVNVDCSTANSTFLVSN